MGRAYHANSDIPLQQIRIRDPFWDKYRDLVGKTIIPYQWEVLNDRLEGVETSHCIENFRIAAGLSDGKYHGMVFQDTDLAKWLEAVGFYLASFGRDEALEKLADEAIDLVGQAQGPDGYLDTYFTICEPDLRWQNLEEGHELYSAGHMIEAAVAYYEGTGKKKLLEIVCRLADLLCETFGTGEGQNHGYPGHPEVEVALVKLYRVTGEKRYLDLAKYFVDARGVGENYFLKEQKRPGHKRIFPDLGAGGYDPAYSQSHMPVREQRTAEGHAVRAGYLYSAMCDLAMEYGDESLLESCEALWDNMVNRRMYVTGSIGSSGFLERFTTDYDLPNDCNYSESCASIALAMFGKRMGQITKDASFMDDVERALYNTILSGIGMDGKHFFYVNPLEVWPPSCMSHTSKEHVKPKRQTWFGVACCPPNIARTLASVGQYMYFLHDNRLSVNLYLSSETEFELCGQKVAIQVVSGLPWKGDVRITLEAQQPITGEIALRIPYYAQNPTLLYEDGTEIPGIREEKGYLVFVPGSRNMTLHLSFDMPAMFIQADSQVRADAGKVALMKGPLVYCLEQADNGENLSQLYVNPEARIEEHFEEELLGGTLVLDIDGYRYEEPAEEASKEPVGSRVRHLYRPATPTVRNLKKVTLRAVPYCYWGNRKPGEEMLVWIRELV